MRIIPSFKVRVIEKLPSLRYNVKVMKFVDTAKISICAGRGGDGHLSFRRTRANAKGGPDGGDGGRGGDVILRANHNSSTLSKYRTNRLWAAEAGQPGSFNHRHGKNGASVTLAVPPGTVAYVDGGLVADLEANGQEQVIARGGRGGFGNAHFTSSTRQAPKFAEVGEPGEQFDITLELKLVADVGLVGLPNAGKSTLLSVISAAKPEIADYPFTTLVPNLGVVDVGDDSFLAADIPGLIEGAALGKGLGDEFLRHIERTKVLLHLIDARGDDIAADYRTIQNELKDYQVDLSTKPQLLVITKSDTVSEDELKEKRGILAAASKRQASDIFMISAVAQKGLKPLLFATQKIIDEYTATEQAEVPERVVITLEDEADTWRVEKVEDVFVISGKKLAGFAARTNFDQREAIDRLRDILQKEGVLREVRRLGGEKGSRLQVGGREFVW